MDLLTVDALNRFYYIF